MVTISAIYPRTEGGRFDYDYYAIRHLRLIRESFAHEGLTDIRAMRGLPGPQGVEPPYFAIVLISFDTIENLRKAMGGEKGQAVLADLPNYSNVTPVLQVNEAFA